VGCHRRVVVDGGGWKLTQPVPERSHVDRVDSLTKMIVTEKDGVCLIVEGERANFDVVGWTGDGETEEPGCMGGWKDEDVTPRVVFGVSRVSQTKSFDTT